MRYQNCRWYDVYPSLSFVLKLVRLLPAETQTLFGERLNDFLSHRVVQSLALENSEYAAGNRWYDEVPVLMAGLERLKQAPQSVKVQSSDFLLQLMKDAEVPSSQCA